MAAAVFVAIIANGLWEFLLRDAVYAGYVKAASGVGEVFHSYFDSLYKGIGNPPWYRLVVVPFVVTIAAIILINLYGLYRIIRRRISGKPFWPGSFSSPRYPSFRDRRFWAMTMVLTINIIGYSEMALSTNYRVGVSNWLDQSIEIIHPYITEREFLVLRSRYRAISNANDFYVLYRAIRKYETEKRIKLFAFEPIGLPEKLN
ncbi:MAG: hypothetical protein ABS93_02230 [Thiobacillus sp. SCN 62-729]|nr:MAG: hypothetical protein ABS93_02230 [Thiobacillus sp. SCN 62-729]